MISAVIFLALKTLVDGRCYPNTFPQEPKEQTWPAIRFSLVSGTPVADVCGTDDGSTDDARWQIDCVAKSYGAARALRDDVVAALMNTDPPCIRESEFEDFDAETKTHRASIDFTFYPSSQ